MPLHFLFPQHFNRHVGQVADDGLNIPAYIAHFGEFGGFHFQEGGIRQFGQPAGDFRFAYAGGADHQDVFRGNFIPQAAVQLHAAPAVTQGNGDGAFCFFLAHDVFVQFVDNLSGSHCRHGRSGRQSLMGSTSRVRF